MDFKIFFSTPFYTRYFTKSTRTMKITAIILLAAALQVSARSSSQTVTLSLKNASLETSFREIENQTGYNFLYFRNQLANTHPVNLEATNLPLQKALLLLFSDQPLTYVLEKNFIVVKQKPIQEPAPVSSGNPPPVDITGRVTDSKGNPVEGVSITLKGTSIGTVSNGKGNYTLQLKDNNGILVFSHIGFTEKEVAINGRSEIDVVLEAGNSSLNEIVVVGYGSVRKGDLTGSVSKVSNSDIESAPVASVDQALQGKAAGVQVTSISGAPGSGTTIRIRGGNSISASNEPLYVIDGFVGGGNLNSINIADIESIEILKDASATAIYGARGANGVILITTKQGKAGKSNITMSLYSGVQHLPREIDLLKGPELANYVNERAAFFGTQPIYPDVSKVTNTDWQKALTRSAGMQNADLSFSGGSEKVTYYLSGNYFNQDGIILNSGFKRYQTRLNLNLKLTDWLTVGTNLNYTRSATNVNKASLYDILKTAPTSLPIFDSTGHYTILSPLTGTTFENPIADARMAINYVYDNSLLGNWYAEASFRNGLRFRSTLDINNDDSTTDQYNPGTLPLRSTQQVGGYAKLISAKSFNLLNENTVSYNKNFGKHHLDLLGGFTYQHETDEMFSATGQGFTNDALTYHNLSTGNPLLAQNTSNQSDWTIISLLTRANYSFKNKYLFTASARQDGSSRLSENHKYAFFPSAAFAWKMSDEDFIKDLGWFSNLKFRTSYGKTGNQAIGVYATLPSLNVSNAYFNGTQVVGYSLGNLPNNNLKWETTDQYDAGLDAGFLKGRLTLGLDVYYKKTYNLLLNVQIPGTTGYSTRLNNVGETENKGLELMLDGLILNGKDLSWDLTLNVSANRNKVLSLGQGLKYLDVTDGARLIVGKPAAVFYGAVYEGTFKSQQEIDALPGYQTGLKPGDAKLKDVNGNGKYDGLTDYAIIGNPEPDFFGGISSLLRYKRLSLNMYFEYSYGNDIINSLGPRLFAGDYASNVGRIALGRWTPANNQSNIPGVGANGLLNVNSQAYSFAVQDGSFLRLKTLQLSYNLTPKKIKWMQEANIYFTASNLFTITHYNYGYDPEVNAQGTNSVLRGFDGTSYPQNRSFVAGINFKF